MSLIDEQVDDDRMLELMVREYSLQDGSLSLVAMEKCLGRCLQQIQTTELSWKSFICCEMMDKYVGRLVELGRMDDVKEIVAKILEQDLENGLVQHLLLLVNQVFPVSLRETLKVNISKLPYELWVRLVCPTESEVAERIEGTKDQHNRLDQLLLINYIHEESMISDRVSQTIVNKQWLHSSPKWFCCAIICSEQGGVVEATLVERIESLQTTENLIDHISQVDDDAILFKTLTRLIQFFNPTRHSPWWSPGRLFDQLAKGFQYDVSILFDILLSSSDGGFALLQFLVRFLKQGNQLETPTVLFLQRLRVTLSASSSALPFNVAPLLKLLPAKR